MIPPPVPARCLPARKINGTARVPSNAGTARYANSASSPNWRATPALSQVIGSARRYGMPDGMIAPYPSASALAANEVVSSSPKNPRSPRPANRSAAATTVIRITTIQMLTWLRLPVIQIEQSVVSVRAPRSQSQRKRNHQHPRSVAGDYQPGDSAVHQEFAPINVKVHATSPGREAVELRSSLTGRLTRMVRPILAPDGSSLASSRIA